MNQAYARLGVDLFTPGKIAKLFAASPAAVQRWIDRGLLKGRRMPGSTHRRVTRAELIRFAREYDMLFALASLGEKPTSNAGVQP